MHKFGTTTAPSLLSSPCSHTGQPEEMEISLSKGCCYRVKTERDVLYIGRGRALVGLLVDGNEARAAVIIIAACLPVLHADEYDLFW